LGCLGLSRRAGTAHMRGGRGKPGAELFSPRVSTARDYAAREGAYSLSAWMA
jgi:hypothetical protein